MDVKSAVAVAKQEIAMVFSDENISNLGLEEVVRDPVTHRWLITIGFNRPWVGTGSALTNALAALQHTSRSYKVVEIEDGTQEVVSIKDRQLQPAA